MLAAEASVDEPRPAGEPRARAEIVDLEVTRSRLQADVTALETQLNDRRTRIKDLLDELQRRVDEGLEGHIARWPTFGEGRLLADTYDPPPPPSLTVPMAPEPPDYVDFGVSEGELEPAPEPVAHVDARELAADAARAQEGLAVPGAGHDVRLHDTQLHDTQLHDTVRSADHVLDDDAFFAQLRGALDDDAPLGPRESSEPRPGMIRWGEERATAVAEAPTLYDQEQPEGRRFGLRRRRQRRRD